MSLSAPTRAWDWTQPNISGETWKCASAPSNLTELERWREEWQIIAKWWWSKLVASYPKIFETVIGAKGVSTRYWAKAVNTYAFVWCIELFFFKSLSPCRWKTALLHEAATSTLYFWDVLCRWWAELVSFKDDSQNWFSSDQRILFLYPSSDLCLKYNPVSAVYRQFLELHGLDCALTCIVNCGTLYRQVCAFPNHVQSTEFTTGGLQSSYRNVSRMISGNRMHLSSILRVMAKAANTYVHVNFLSCFFLSLLFLNTNNSNKLISCCHYGVLFVKLWGK